LLLPAIQAAREAARRTQCQSNLHNVALAVLNYESSNKILPNGMSFDPSKKDGIETFVSGAGTAGSGYFGPNWIISILPNMEEQGLHDSFDPRTLVAPYPVGVDDPTANSRNSVARATTIPSLLCPSDPFNKQQFKDPKNGLWARGNYAASVGRA